MDKAERELQKERARKLLLLATTTEERAHAVFMLIEAYYYRNDQYAPSLAVYASHWLWASQRDEDLPKDAFELLVKRYPLPRNPKIQMGYSDCGSYGDRSYPVEDLVIR